MQLVCLIVGICCIVGFSGVKHRRVETLIKMLLQLTLYNSILKGNREVRGIEFSSNMRAYRIVGSLPESDTYRLKYRIIEEKLQ